MGVVLSKITTTLTHYCVSRGAELCANTLQSWVLSPARHESLTPSLVFSLPLRFLIKYKMLHLHLITLCKVEVTE